MPYAFSRDTFGLEAGRFRIAIQRLLVLVDGSASEESWTASKKVSFLGFSIVQSYMLGEVSLAEVWFCC